MPTHLFMHMQMHIDRYVQYTQRYMAICASKYTQLILHCCHEKFVGAPYETHTHMPTHLFMHMQMHIDRYVQYTQRYMAICASKYTQLILHCCHEKFVGAPYETHTHMPTHLFMHMQMHIDRYVQYTQRYMAICASKYTQLILHCCHEKFVGAPYETHTHTHTCPHTYSCICRCILIDMCSIHRDIWPFVQVSIHN